MPETRDTWKGTCMARVRSLEREDLPAEHQQIYDDIAGSRGRVQPNFKALLNNPLATSRMAALGGYVRFETPLSPRVKALAVLATARENDGDYVWTANLPQAHNAGVDEETIQAIRERRAPYGLASEDALIVQFTLELLRQHRITDATFQAVQHRLGDAGVIDLLILIGYYGSLSHTLSALEVMPPGPSAL
jgi:4-carboxymuconolactone decarboxylase